MYKSIGAVLLAILLYGCSTTQKINVPDAGVTVIDYGPDRRGAYLMKTDEGKHIIVSEPAPDVALEITASLGVSAKTIGNLADPNLKADYANKVVDLASRSQTLQVLRESLFRLSEMSASSDISDEQRMTLFTKVLDTVKVIAATELINVGASSGIAPATLEDVLKDVLEGTVKIPKGP